MNKSVLTPKPLWEDHPQALSTTELVQKTNHELIAQLKKQAISCETQLESSFVTLQDIGSLLPHGHADAHIQTCSIPLKYLHLYIEEIATIATELEARMNSNQQELKK